MAMEASSSTRDIDLVKTLKQILEAPRLSSATSSSGSVPKSVTLFGKKLSVGSNEEDVQRVSERLPPSALVQLKGLYQQHLLKRKAHRSDAPVTLPLLDDNGSVGVKRQRLGPDQQIPVSGSQPASSAGLSLQSGLVSAEDLRTGPSFQPVDDNEQRTEKGAPLTVFYNGMVYVYDDIPADKAQAIMILAESASSCISRTNSVEKFTLESVAPQESAPAKRKFTLADLPQARKASLQRFLEKRKDRLIIKVEKKPIKSFTRAPQMRRSPKLEALAH